MSKKVFLIGHPVGHSISPAFQQAALDHHGLNIIYESIDIDNIALEETIQKLRHRDVLGANITVPHKESVIPMLDNALGDVAAIGAVNTIVNNDGILTGYNTDVIGFLQSLRKHGELEPAGKSALILGAGGSARAVSVALAKEGASSIFIANRNLKRAQNLIDTLRPLGNFSGAIALNSQSMKSIAANSDIIINCTSLGMHGGPGATLSPIDKDLIPQKALVIDLVYNPPETPLLKGAKSVGAKTLSGLYMLVYQGSASFKIWTDLEPPLDIMLEVANRALREKYTN